jgi:hypothetical protein
MLPPQPRTTRRAACLAMTRDDLHALLTATFGLVCDNVERGNARSYFVGNVEWAPARSTRLARVEWDTADQVTRVRLCVSSDNNNSVFIATPIEPSRLQQRIAEEIAHFQAAREQER